MNSKLPQNMKEIITAFNEWYKNDDHSESENRFKDEITTESLSQLSDDAFITFFEGFLRNGGFIMSGGHRNVPSFISYINTNETGELNNLKDFREKVLQPFQPDFDVDKWLEWSEKVTGFGQGIATIYLNRVNKDKYCVVNNKSIEAYQKLGYEIKKTPLISCYNSLYNAEADLIERYPALKNFYKSDSLSHFLIGTDIGKDMLPITSSILTDGELKRIAESSAKKIEENEGLRNGWVKGLSDHIKKYSLPNVNLKNQDTLNDLFNSEAVCSTGAANSLPIANALNDEEFRKLFSKKVNDIIAKDNKILEDYTKLYDELIEELKLRCGSKPKLKLSRALCALFPEQVSVIGNFATLKKLYDAIFEDKSKHPVEMHSKVFAKLNDLLGPIDKHNTQKFVERMILPWQIQEDLFGDFGVTKQDEDKYPRIWKISHGRITDFSIEEHNRLLENNYVATNFLPENKLHQKLEAIQPNHYFYLVRDAQIILLGQLENEQSKEIEGMPGQQCRKFKPVKMLDTPYPVKKLEKKYLSFGGMPSSNSTVEEVKSKYLKYFESDVLQPVFKLSLEDLAQDNAAYSKGNKMNSLNQVLYGPPGTGKTYNTVTEALKVLVEIIVDDEEYGDGYSKDKRRFDALKAKGHIEFITFHQSFSYEDFVEGIRAETNDGGIIYSVKDGIFKKIAIEALFSKLELSGDKLDAAWQKVIDNNNVIANKKITVETKFDPNDSAHKKLILAVHKRSDFKEGKGEPYVLIIDEINRGNTSRIFGELITLIESTKRAGSDEAMDAVLPYSQETFTVPDNLYIIGTMNTADRSLALIDTALRRRFDFIEKIPDVTLIKDKKSGIPIVIGGVDIPKMLETINDRIEVLYDREHTIGHAFFMKLTDDSTIRDLASVFRRNILPLLEEYFFEDWKKICQVLGNSGIYKVKDFKEPGLSAGNNYSRDEKLLAMPETYINIYKDTDSTQRDSTGSS